jgi:hypothetical protein
MAYADRTLPASELEQLARIIEADAALTERLAAFRATTQARLRPVFDELQQMPVPDRLVQTIVGFERRHGAGGEMAGGGAQQRPKANAARAGRGWMDWLSGGARFGPGALAFASLAALALGLAGGWLAREGAGGSGFLVGGIGNGASLAAVLDSKISGSASRRVAAGTIEPVLSFRSKQGGYCREYRAADKAAVFAGVACKTTDGRWRVLAHVATGSAPGGANTGGFVPAGGPRALDSLVGQLMSGDALGDSDERKLIETGWK